MKNTKKGDLRRFLHQFYEEEGLRKSQELVYVNEQHKTLLNIHFNNLHYIIGKNSLCIDVGCSEGLYTQFMASLASFVVGVDISFTKIRKGGCKSKKENINFVQADWNHLPFRDKSFNIALFSEGPEHSIEPLRTLHEIRRVVRFNGFLEVSAPVELSHTFIPACIKVLFRKSLRLLRRDVFIGHLNEFTKKELKTLIRKSGFSIVKSTFDLLIDRSVDYPFRISFEKLLKRQVFPYGVILAQKKIC